MTQLRIYVTPKAGTDAVGVWRGDELAVRVSVAPEGGKANAAACRVIADALGVAKSAVTVVRGATARHKVVEIEGVGEDGVRAAFGSPDAALF